MSLENNISKVIQEQLQGDLIEKVIGEQLEKCVRRAVDDLFGGWGDCKKIIEEKVKEVMIPQLEKYDYSKHIVKLDAVLTEVMKRTSVDNKKIIESFKEFYLEEIPSEITITDMFNRYKKHVEENVETDGLEIDYDDGPSYSSVEVSVEVEESEKSWSKYKDIKIHFECEHDEEMNFTLRALGSEDKDYYFLTDNLLEEFGSIRRSTSFELFLLRMRSEYTNIKLDIMNDCDDVYPEAEPECDWS